MLDFMNHMYREFNVGKKPKAVRVAVRLYSYVLTIVAGLVMLAIAVFAVFVAINFVADLADLISDKNSGYDDGYVCYETGRGIDCY